MAKYIEAPNNLNRMKSSCKCGGECFDIKYNMARECRAIGLVFNKFRGAANSMKKFSADDEALIKLTLNNLLTEIRTATEVIKKINCKGGNRTWD